VTVAQSSITFRIEIAWWVRWYISGVALFAQTFGFEPDLEKVRRTVMKGCRPVLVR
jgi:hypothetical protein